MIWTDFLTENEKCLLAPQYLHVLKKTQS